MRDFLRNLLVMALIAVGVILFLPLSGQGVALRAFGDVIGVWCLPHFPNRGAGAGAEDMTMRTRIESFWEVNHEFCVSETRLQPGRI